MSKYCKRFYFLSTFLGLTLFFPGFSITTNAQQTYFSKPGKSIKYYPDGTGWQPIFSNAFKYNAAGQMTEDLQQDVPNNQNFSHFFTQYDSSGNFKSRLGYFWGNGRWELKTGQRDSLLYNGNKLSEKYTSYWNSNYSHWEKLWTVYVYDANNFLIQENTYFSYMQSGTWSDHSKIVYKNDANGVITRKQYYTFYASKWELLKTENYMSWHIPNVLPAVYTSDETWSKRITIQLGPNDSQTKTTEFFNLPGNAWVFFQRETTTNDFRGNFIGYKAENYNATTGEWTTREEYGQRHVYNNYFDITETMHFRFVPSNNGMKPFDEFKFVYSDFQYFGQAPFKAINSYPNPTTGLLNFSLGDQEQGSLQVIILDLAGKTRLTRSFSATEKKLLSIETLPTGIYLVHLQTEAGSTVKRIVKQ